MACRYRDVLMFLGSFVMVLVFLSSEAMGEHILLDWNVSMSTTIMPVNVKQPVITINDMFPGPLINVTTNDIIHVNVFNHLDEPFLMTWNGIQQRMNSWQDGVSGTNCPIQPGTNWTYVFSTKDQIGSFFYFPSLNFHKAAGGYGPIRLNNRVVIPVPFDKPEAEFDLLIGDWSSDNYKKMRKQVHSKSNFAALLMNGKPPYNMDNKSNSPHESITVEQGKTYRLRISNVGIAMSFNFRIQDHKIVLVETEGSYTSKITLDSLDVHVGQSYSVLVTADQSAKDYYMVATPTQVNSSIFGLGVIHYSNSTTPPSGPYPSGPNATDPEFSVNQARSIRWNTSAGAARPNPQGSFNVRNVNLSRTIVLNCSMTEIDGVHRYTVNNISYLIPTTPLKLADHFSNGSAIDYLPVNVSNNPAASRTFVVGGSYRKWVEIIFRNELNTIGSWHLDGFGFYVVGFGYGDWNLTQRQTYNLNDPVFRSTVQVYPGMWTAVYVYLDNPGMWNIRSQHLDNWYHGQELYIRVKDPDPSAREQAPPVNLLQCGSYAPPPAPQSSGSSKKVTSYFVASIVFFLIAFLV